MVKIDMDMPECCEDCRFCQFSDISTVLYCMAVGKPLEDDEGFDHAEERADFCPLLCR